MCEKCLNAKKWSLTDCSADRKTTTHEKRNREIDYYHRYDCEESVSIAPKCTITKHFTAEWSKHKIPSRQQKSSESGGLNEHTSNTQTSKSCTSVF